MNYSKGTISYYHYTWNHLKKYAAGKGVSTFTLDLGMQFLSDHYNLDLNAKLSYFHVSLVRRIKVLEEFKNTSRFCLCHQKNPKEVPEQFAEIFKSYQNLQSDLKFSQWTVHSKSLKVRNFLIFLSSKGINNLSKLSIADIYDYCSCIKDFSSLTKPGILFTLRDFLKFLYREGLIAKEVSDIFPVIVSNKFEVIPSFYTKTEIGKILGCVNRQTKIGKRDYAVLILAIQLGIRVGDIRQLKLEHIRYPRTKVRGTYLNSSCA